MNCTTLGDPLWQKVTLPTISNGAGMWFNNTKKSQHSLQVYQYMCAKSILKIQSMPAKIAKLSHLAWVPVLDHLDALRLNYVNYLCQMDDDKVAKHVFNGLWEQIIESGCEVFK